MDEKKNSSSENTEQKKTSGKAFDRIVSIILLGICAALALGIFTKVAAAGTKGASAMPAAAGGMGAGAPGGMPSGASGAKAAANLINVSAEKVHYGTYEKSVTLDGDVVTASKSVNVVPQVGGTVKELYVKEHESVTEGQLLGYVDASKPGNYYKPSAITAPITGTVDSLNVIVGTEVSATTALMVIAQPTSLKITTDLPERYVSKVEKGMNATFTSVAYPGEVFTGKISYVGKELNTKNRTLPIEIAIEKQNLLKAGMYVEIQMVVESQANVLLINSDAVKNYIGEKVVYVVENGVASRRTVTIGSDNGNETIILSGLKPGETVITAGSVTDGSQVKVLD